MPRTIEEGFAILLSWLNPTATETAQARSHRASIEACLLANFGLDAFFRSGSFGNGTSVSGCSDVDYFAVIPVAGLPANSSVALGRIRETLDLRFPRTGVYTDCPAVVAPFGQVRSEDTEIVPAARASAAASPAYAVYVIPDCRGGWRYSSPRAHNAFVAAADARLGGRVKPLVRFVRAWKYARNVPVSSFYLELQVAAYANTQDAIVYDLDVRNVLELLWLKRLAPLDDPMGIAGQVPASKTAAQWEQAMSKLLTALNRAEKACAAAWAGDTRSAFSWWGLLYDGQFPSYRT